MSELFSPGEIPPGITIGNKVVLIPALSSVFDHSGFTGGLYSRRNYTWIQRGDYFAKYVIYTPRVRIPVINITLSENRNEVFLQSPVSGLIIHPSYEFNSEIVDYYRDNDPSFEPPARMSILLPDDEPPAENGQFLFSDFCRFCWEHRSPLS